ncbi:MAG TPA: acylphosphatase [Burkholderiales bacterium]|nr:acylphosphatase [Burkholderiales bacterium]
MTVTLHVLVAGQVQGVGYRDGLSAQALRHGVRGWVRNRRDGTVEAILQGEPGAVEAVVAWARRGPSAAHVSDITTRPATGDLDRPYQGFDWLPTA